MEIWGCPVCWAHPAERCLEPRPRAVQRQQGLWDAQAQDKQERDLCLSHPEGLGYILMLCSLPAGLAALQRFPIAFGTFSVTLGCGGAGIEQWCTLHRAWTRRHFHNPSAAGPLGREQCSAS